MHALNTQKRECNDKVLKAVDKVLRKIFGNEATGIIYKYLESHHSLSQDQIVEKIDVFAEGLEEFLNSGAQIIEMNILQDMYSSYGLTPKEQFEERRNQHDFVGQMKLLMQKT